MTHSEVEIEILERCFLRALSAVLRDALHILGFEDRDVRPRNLPERLDAAKQSHFVSHAFFDEFCRPVDWQAKNVRCRNEFVPNFHSHVCYYPRFYYTPVAPQRLRRGCSLKSGLLATHNCHESSCQKDARSTMEQSGACI